MNIISRWLNRLLYSKDSAVWDAPSEELLQIKQDSEDKRIELDAKAEALEMYMQYLNGDILLIPKPRRCLIMVYTKSKYDSESYNQLRIREFNKFKAEGKQILYP